MVLLKTETCVVVKGLQIGVVKPATGRHAALKTGVCIHTQYIKRKVNDAIDGFW
jgi:hypothetical protein